MSSRNSNVFGVVAGAAVLLCILFLMRKRLRPGFLIFSLAVAVVEKWREQRDLEKVHSLLQSEVG